MAFFDESAFDNCDTMMAVDDQSVPQVENITKDNDSFNTLSTRSIYILLAPKHYCPNTIWTSSGYYVHILRYPMIKITRLSYE